MHWKDAASRRIRLVAIESRSCFSLWKVNQKDHKIFYEWRKTAGPKLPFAIAMKDGRPFTFAPTLEKTGKILSLENGCALARGLVR